MKKQVLLFSCLIALFISCNIAYAQGAPVLYFCERYDSDDGEIGISDRFTTGYLTVVVKSDSKLGLRDVHIQMDKWDNGSRKFKFYKKFDYTIEPSMKYVYFTRNDDSDMSFEDPGFYRVFLLNNDDETVASALVQIIE